MRRLKFARVENARKKNNLLLQYLNREEERAYFLRHIRNTISTFMRKSKRMRPLWQTAVWMEEKY
jgi:hypothetical protein